MMSEEPGSARSYLFTATKVALHIVGPLNDAYNDKIIYFNLTHTTTLPDFGRYYYRELGSYPSSSCLCQGRSLTRIAKDRGRQMSHVSLSTHAFDREIDECRKKHSPPTVDEYGGVVEVDQAPSPLGHIRALAVQACTQGMTLMKWSPRTRKVEDGVKRE